MEFVIDFRHFGAAEKKLFFGFGCVYGLIKMKCYVDDNVAKRSDTFFTVFGPQKKTTKKKRKKERRRFFIEIV
jgi:hypothetical protein